MSIETAALLDALNSVTAIPIIPFNADGSVDYKGHAKNVNYLMENNHLSDGFSRIGTSLTIARGEM